MRVGRSRFRFAIGLRPDYEMAYDLVVYSEFNLSPLSDVDPDTFKIIGVERGRGMKGQAISLVLLHEPPCGLGLLALDSEPAVR